LGIPTVKDRVVQAAVKNILEPIFEADFFPTSYGFRPGKSVHGALTRIKALLKPTTSGLPYQWAIEGDIKGCFDNINHHGLMNRLRRRVSDSKACRLVVAFLKAGILSEGQFARTDIGTPQGGILSPLLANIALSAIDERYKWHVWPRQTPKLRKPVRTEPAAIAARAIMQRQLSRKRGEPVLYPIRYADDFLILVGVASGQEHRAQATALEEKAALAAALKEELGLELSEQKTLVTPVTSNLRFLGHHVRVRQPHRRNRMKVTVTIPKDRSKRLRQCIKDMFRRATVQASLDDRLRHLNPRVRGWASFYRHAWGAKRVFQAIDHYVWWTILRWVKKKHHRVPMRKLIKLYGWRKPGGRMLRWRGREVLPYSLASVRVCPYRFAWERAPDFAATHGEPGAERKPHAGFGGGRAETTR